MAKGRGLCAALVLATALGCAREAVPVELIGRWTSDDPRYANRALEIGTEQIAFHWVPVSAQDAPPATRGLHEIRAIWDNSTKHVQTESIYSAREAQAGQYSQYCK